MDNKRFSVVDAIWIAAVVFAYNQSKKPELKEDDFYLKATELRSLAMEYTKQDVQLARIHQHCNGDHANCSHRFLRRRELIQGYPEFRVTAAGEFGGDKEFPSDLNFDEKILINGQEVSLRVIMEFVQGAYTKLFEKNRSVEMIQADAVWIATACMIYKNCARKPKTFTKKSIFFDIDEIIIIANQFIEHRISKDTILQYMMQNKYHYLVEDNGKYRVSFMNEFICKKECPDISVINSMQKVFINEKAYELQKVFSFINIEYTERVKKNFGDYKPTVERINKNEVFADMDKKENYDLNMILYGPPGTGKTYHTAIYAVAICDGKNVTELTDYNAVMKRYEELKKENRIAFTTFHQSYGYEEFIEGIKPVVDTESENVSYTIASGVFKSFCDMARIPDNIEIDHNAKIWIARLNGGTENDLKNECFQNGEIRFNWDKEETNDYVKWFKQMQPGDYVLSYAGESKYIDAIGVIGDQEPRYDEEKTSFMWTRDIRWLITDIKEDVKEINGNVWLPNFEIARLKHMKMSDLLSVTGKYTNYVSAVNEKPYVFIIDEINRGNISKIFGELITLIENTKRDGMDEAASAILPYSNEAFSVPKNVYILGTMNTADRSIALMDTALRRRFQFVEMMPKTDVLRKMEISTISTEGKEIDVALMLDKINERIEYLFDREHTIGHAFFTALKNEPTINKLASIFEKSVIPLLQEYFYEDYGKIQMILGDNDAKVDDDNKFIVSSEIKAQKIFRGDVSDLDLPDYKYEIKYENFRRPDTYIKIYSEI